MFDVMLWCAWPDTFGIGWEEVCWPMGYYDEMDYEVWSMYNYHLGYGYLGLVGWNGVLIFYRVCTRGPYLGG